MLRVCGAEKPWLKHKETQLLSLFISAARRAVTVATMPRDTVNMQQGLAGSGHTGLSSPLSIKPQTTN